MRDGWQSGGPEIPYSEFKTLLRDRVVEEVELRGDLAEGRLRDARPLGPGGQETDRFRTRIPALGDDSLLPTIEETGVRLLVGEAEGGWRALFLAAAPWLLMAFFFWFLYRSGRNLAGGLGGRGDLQQFLRGSLQEKETPKVTFADVAGQENAKREVEELVDFLKNPAKYVTLGAEVPRGVLLMGPPGTGKTLLARALAGEAHVPFFAISGSEFIEVFVGVGASRVRNLFEAAKKNAPSIIFIDELDSVGRTRGTGLGGGHDEREQTLNQILAGMDGFEEHQAVIVLAATNRPDVLDPALLRPGRFDRHVVLDLPDRKDRLKILRVHLRRIPLDPSVNLEAIATGTPGFSGADLKNLINEAALLAARMELKTVTTQHLEEARDKLLLGTERALTILPEEKHRLAVHESGHALLAYFLRHTDPLYKVTIIPRGRTLGGTQQLPENERHTLPEEYLRDRLVVILGGRTAERELLGSVSSGADDDIREATRLARAMVARWGMSPEVGPVDLRESEEHPFLGREMAQPRRFSESSAQAVDDAVRKLLIEAEKTAGEVIRAHRGELGELVARLEKDETLHREDIEKYLARAPVAGLRQAQ
jgi:cell division protease FtsH